MNHVYGDSKCHVSFDPTPPFLSSGLQNVSFLLHYKLPKVHLKEQRKTKWIDPVEYYLKSKYCPKSELPWQRFALLECFSFKYVSVFCKQWLMNGRWNRKSWPGLGCTGSSEKSAAATVLQMCWWALRLLGNKLISSKRQHAAMTHFI